MKNRTLVLASWVAITGALSTNAIAVDSPVKILPVFRVEFEPEDKFRHLVFTDVHATTGIELVAGADRCSVSAPDVNGNVKTTGKMRLIYRPATGGSTLIQLSPLPTVSSAPYPDPTNPNNQCDGENATFFDEGDFPNTQMLGCPRDPEDPPYNGTSFNPNEGDCAGVKSGHFGIGVATGGGSVKYLVYSDAVTGTYYNATTISDVDVTQFAIHVYNMAGTRIWTKTFAGASASLGRLEPVLSGVGDFLNADGEDELRVGRIKETGTGATFYYVYYDLDTGAQIGSTINVPVSNP